MPKINSVTVSLDGDKQVYKPGDWVKGQWKIDVGEAFSVRGVRLTLLGAAYTRWSDDNPRNDDKIGYEKFTSQWTTVFGTKLGETSSGNHMYPTGKHVHRFSFQIPADRIPSSYEGKYGAIRYWLYLEIDRPLLRFNITRIKVISILENIDVNDAQYTRFVARKCEKKVCKAIVVGDEGNVVLHAQTDRGAYCPGEKMAISLIAHNQTQRELGIVKATLMQRVNFFAGGEEKVKDTLLQSVTGAVLKKEEKRNWTRQILTVPSIPPTTTERACQIVRVKYFLKVFVDIPMIHGGDAYVMIPVTIGTVPQGHSSRSAAASNSFEIDASSVITYAECTRGFEQFSKGESKFPATSYVPWCSFVPNFKFPQTPAARPKTAPQNKASPARAQAAPAIPSAPPIEIMPPSYDDVMKQIADAKTEQTTRTTAEPERDTTTDASAEATPPMPERVTLALLLMRFPDRVLNEFRDTLVQCAGSLKTYQGQALALAPQVIVSTGSWPQRTSIAMLVFPTRQDADDWFKEFNALPETNGVTLQDAFVLNTHELFQNEKSVFNLNLICLKPGNKVRANIAKEYRDLASQLITPLRVSMGGVNVTKDKATTHLVGEWPDSKHFNIVSQWDSLKQYSKYRGELEKEKYKKFLALTKEMFEYTLTITFQSEDLSFVQDAQIGDDSEGVQEDPDDRREEVASN